MIFSPHAQHSVEWMQARAGIPTASEFGNLVSDTFEIRKGEMPKTYLAKKLAEAWLGGSLAEFSSWDMDQGTILEEEAIPWFEFEHGVKVDRVGLITTDDGRIGASPDGLLGDGLVNNAGLEIKCPRIETHIKYLLKGGLPAEYGPQVHGGMLVTDMPMWTFVSYSRRLPKLVLSVTRDEKIQAVLQEALGVFQAGFEKGWEKLCDMNGGPPKKRKDEPIPEIKPEPELTYLQ